MRTIAVIGKNFGDEGKGLAVDYLARSSPHPMVVRHNGGAQSGHTVERSHPAQSRFVFHELSSGSACRADTLWASGYYPDLLKLGEEVESFRQMFGFIPGICAMHDTCITVPDDVLINMALETSRGDGRHGSCGMGINECDIRTKAGYGLKFEELSGLTAREMYGRLYGLRKEYTTRRLQELRDSLSSEAQEYLDLLSNDNVLQNAADIMTDNLRYMQVLSLPGLMAKLDHVDTLIFETGQGLLLDRDNREAAPHVTASNTGLRSIRRFLDVLGLPLDEAVYVSRTYVTRHGAGPLIGECSPDQIGQIQRDRTNEPNEWQGRIRYARHRSCEGFVEDVRKDVESIGGKDFRVSLFLTHLNETGFSLAMEGGDLPLREFLHTPCITEMFDDFYFSASPFPEDVKRTCIDD